MKDENKTRMQLMNELAEMRQRVAELEATYAKPSQKAAFEARREGVQRLRQVVERTEALLVNVNPRGRISYANEAAAKVLGRRPEEVVGALYLRFVHPKDRPRVSKAYKAQVESEASSTSLEFRIVTADDEVKWVNFVAHPLARDGETVELAGVALDVTERKRAKEALQASEERYRTIFEHSPISIWEEDFSGVKVYLDELRASGVEDFQAYFDDHPEAVRHCATLVEIIDVNWAGLQLYEAESKTQLLEGLETIFVEETYPGFKEELVSIAEGKARVEVETVNRTLTGKKRNLVVTWHVVPGHEESLSRCIVSIRDVTRPKRMEEALRKHVTQMESLREVGLEIAAQLDLEEALRAIVSRAIELVDGSSGGLNIYRPEQDLLEFAIHVGLDSVPDDLTLRKGEGFDGKVWESGEPMIVDDYQAWEGHSEIWAEHLGHSADIGVPIYWGDEFLGVLGVMADPPRTFSQEDADLLTLFATQAAIAIHNARLYEQAQQEIAERRKMQAALARSNAELEQYAYVISHDLREPLRVATGYLRLLHERYQDQLDARANRYIDHAVDAAERMKMMTQALLDISRVERRGQPFAPVDCEALLDRTLQALQIAIQESEAVVTCDALPTVMADQAQLGQVFQNLLDNAIKFRGDERPHVHVSAERRGDEWVFSVEDNGIGIDPEQAAHIFEIFQRLHTADEYPGHGIGLALCKKIVERHGGRMWVESEPGAGSTLYFTMPALVPGDGD